MEYKRRTATILTMVLGLAVLFGCAAGQKEYQIGMQLTEAGQYKEAIAYLEKAIAKEPGNKEYRQALGSLKEKLVRTYVAAGRKALASQDPVGIGAINRAKEQLAEARQINGEHPEVRQLLAQVSALEKGLVSDMEKLYGEARTAMESKEWLKAYFNLQQIQSRFPNYEDTFQMMNLVRGQGVDDLFGQARAAFDAEDFKGAVGAIRKALSIRRDHQPSRELLSLAQERDSKGYFVEQARDAVMAQKWNRAVYLYERALEYAPDDEDLQQLIAHVRNKAGQFNIRKARNLMDEGALLKAIKVYEVAVKYIQDPKDYQINSLKRDLVARAKFAADHFKDQGQYGSAWYWYTKMQEIDPDYPNIFFLTQRMEDEIRQRVQKSIAVFDFGSPSNNSDAGIIVANSLITYLFNNASGDIKILERENLKSILEEMKLGQIGVVSGSTAKQMGSVYGIDVAIMGSVLLYNVDSSSSEGTKSVRYRIGERIEDNIEYLNWDAKFKHRKPTDAELAEAPPAKIKVPVYADKDYRVSHHKKVGFVQISFRIVDVNTGENIQVRNIEAKETVEDDTSAGLEDAGIRFDPLEIPTDTELLQKLTGRVVAELGREALRPLQNLERTYFQMGEKLLRRRSNLQAAESFVDSIFDEKMKMVQGSPMTRRSFEYLNDIFENYKVEVRTGG